MKGKRGGGSFATRRTVETMQQRSEAEKDAVCVCVCVFSFPSRPPLPLSFPFLYPSIRQLHARFASFPR